MILDEILRGPFSKQPVYALHFSSTQLWQQNPKGIRH